MANGTDGTRRNAATGESYLPHQEPRYREIASFLRAPLAESLDELDIALVGIPFDGGVSNRPGARHGPREIRNQSSMMRSLHHITRLDPFAQARIADIGDVRFSSIYDLEQVSNNIAAYRCRRGRSLPTLRLQRQHGTAWRYHHV